MISLHTHTEESPRATPRAPPTACKGKNQYGKITQEYKKSKELPFRVYSERPTFLNLLGKDLGSKNVMDFACGEGHYTRMIRERTTEIVTGVDISPEMIELARHTTTTTTTTTTTSTNNHCDNPQADDTISSSGSIEYIVHDCCNLEFMTKYSSHYDIVTATYLLNYATEVEMIGAFATSAYTLLKPNGRFVGINTSPFITTASEFEKTAHYNISYTPEREIIQEGDALPIRVYGDGFEARFDNYFWSAETYEKAIRAAGFTEFRWVPFEVTAEKEDEWKVWKEHTPLICFEAVKSA